MFNIRKSTNVTHHINKGQKSYGCFNRCKKSIWQNPRPFHNKSIQQTRYWRGLPQPDKPLTEPVSDPMVKCESLA